MLFGVICVAFARRALERAGSRFPASSFDETLHIQVEALRDE